MKKNFVSSALLVVALTAATSSVMAQNLVKDAQRRLLTLESLVVKANKKGINTLKEETTIRTSEIFLDYAAWDEKNVEANTRHFEGASRYKAEAAKYAEELPDFERGEIIAMLDSSIAELSAVMRGEIKRLDTPNIDWSKVELVGDELRFDDRPIFLADWTWKPQTKRYTEYHGNQGGQYISSMFLQNAKGDISPYLISELETKKDGPIGFVFIGHNATPKWAKALDPSITEGSGIKYTEYDISNPLAREMQSMLLSKTVPLMAGKKYTQLGYMLCNEPHWNSIKGEWAAGPISDLAYEGFRQWLKERHKSIETLNGLWGSTYTSFEEIDTPRIMEASKQGTPYYFDFMRYNMDRVTEWFEFLASEVKRYDPAAKTHIKVMPNLWSEGKRDHGVDMEAITRNSGIIGNDASTCGAYMWGKPQPWEARYSYNWREICMAYDFFKSVSPDKIMYNTEGHMLSTNRSRDLYQTIDYTRNNYWLATIHGLTSIQTWYWARLDDGSSKAHFDSNGYAASNNHQPRVVNEVHMTYLDLNSVSEDIMSFQRQCKPIRIFYTEASAINSQEYIEDIYDAYESLFFEGTPLGFATAGIIDNNDNKSWDVVLVTKTPQMFEADVEALQRYVDQGGVVILDEESMLTNEYGNPLAATLRSTKGRVEKLASFAEQSEEAFDVIEGVGGLPALIVKDENGTKYKGCTWRTIKGQNGEQLLNLVNLSKNPTKITVEWRDGRPIGSLTNVLTGESVENGFVLQRDGVLLLDVK